MTKMKALWLLVCGALLAVFIIQNWQNPEPPVQFLGFHILPLPQSVIILGCLVLGFLAGLLTYSIRVKRSQQEPPPE
jgi:uncharacterized integral membrane protein